VSSAVKNCPVVLPQISLIESIARKNPVGGIVMIEKTPGALVVLLTVAAISNAAEALVLTNFGATIDEVVSGVDFLGSGAMIGASLSGEPVEPENTPPIGVDDYGGLAFPGTVFNLQFLATDAEDPVSALVWSDFFFTGLPGYGGTGVYAISPMFNPDGSFKWDSSGSTPGVYIASATVTDTGGLTSSAYITMEIVVPEPTTIGLAGLALVGIVGLFRRRS
jgi:hypothetical protein